MLDAFGSKLDVKMHLEHVPSSLVSTARESRFTQRGSVYRMRRTVMRIGLSLILPMPFRGPGARSK